MAAGTNRSALSGIVTGFLIALMAASCSMRFPPNPASGPALLPVETGIAVPCPSVAPDALGYVCMEFDGHTYRGVAAQEAPQRQSGAGSLTITRDLLSKIGSASSVNADIGTTDWSVYEIAGVDPADAVAMYIGSGQAFMNVWTRDGVSPSTIPGLCQHYLDPSLRLCLARPEPPIDQGGTP